MTELFKESKLQSKKNELINKHLTIYLCHLQMNNFNYDLHLCRTMCSCILYLVSISAR